MRGKALITGGAGFIGAHLVEALLSDDWRVDIIENFQRAVEDVSLSRLLENPRARLSRQDLTDDDCVNHAGRDYDVIFHLAAIIGVRHVEKDGYRVLIDNFRMTHNILEIAKRQEHLRRFLFASTSEVTAGALANYPDSYPIPTPESVPLTLNDLVFPRTTYMLSKMHGEAMCQMADVPFTILRPHNIYGPRMGLAHVIPEMLKRAFLAGDCESFAVASAEHRRAFCFCRDAVELIVRLMDNPLAEGETFNIGNQSQEISILDLARVVTTAVGKNLDLVAKPATPGSPARRCPDMTKTISVAGYSPAVGINEGVAETFSWYETNVFAQDGLSAQ